MINSHKETTGITIKRRPKEDSNTATTQESQQNNQEKEKKKEIEFTAEDPKYTP